MYEDRKIIIEIFEKVLTENEACFNRWVKFADGLMKLMFHGNKARHYDPKDVVREVILKIMEGKRKWDRKKVPDLDKFVKKNIQSFISNLRVTEKIHVNIDCYTDCEENEIDVREIIHCVTLEEIELSYDLIEQLGSFIERLKQDKEFDCLTVLDLLAAGYKNQEISELLNMSTREVVNIKRKIRYKLEQFL
jgi:hypothetical protein